jgi:hypothetical protein
MNLIYTRELRDALASALVDEHAQSGASAAFVYAQYCAVATLALGTPLGFATSDDYEDADYVVGLDAGVSVDSVSVNVDTLDAARVYCAAIYFGLESLAYVD